MTRIAYFDLASGASGDMIIAGLTDAGRSLGVDVGAVVADAVVSLGLGCSVSFIDDHRGGLACLRAEVKTDDTPLGPDRLRDAIERADVVPAVRQRAHRGLEALLVAEAAVHGTSSHDVELHELGTADTAADLMGAAVALNELGCSGVYAAPVPVPTGWITSGHGPLPLPAPVTLEMLAGATLRGTDETFELVTPTAAAILTSHGAIFGPLPELTLHATGTGGGTRDTERPNICRVLVGARPDAGARLEPIVLLETNIDDQTPESLGHAVETILGAGALDAWITPILMKRTRPAFLLSVLVSPADETVVLESIFRHTTSIGVRRRETTRWALERTSVVVRVGEDDVAVKVATLGEAVVNVAPEFRDCANVAARSGRTVEEVYAEATSAAGKALGLPD